MRNRANELLADPAELDRLLAHGADKCPRDRLGYAGASLRAVGFLPYAGSRPESARPMSSVSKVTANEPKRATARAVSSAAPDVQDTQDNGHRSEGISIGVILGFPDGDRRGAPALACLFR